jgi:hypothetical protein
MSALATAAQVLSFLGAKHEDLPDGHERLIVLGIPLWDSRRAARRLERRRQRIALRKARRDARK